MAKKRDEKTRSLILELRAKHPNETGEQIAERASLILNKKFRAQQVSYYLKPVK